MLSNHTPRTSIFLLLHKILGITYYEYQPIAFLHHNIFFICSLIVKLALILTTIPDIYLSWFLPFFSHSFSSFSLDPWHQHLISGGSHISFPYGPFMYISLLPLSFLGYLFDQLFSTHPTFLSIGILLTILLFDYLTLCTLTLLSCDQSPNFLLVFYWCSPISFFILYWHGQLDIIPVFFLLLGLLLLYKKRLLYSSIFFALSISSKLTAIWAFIFILLYLLKSRIYLNYLGRYFTLFFIAILFTLLPWLISSSYSSFLVASPVLSSLSFLSANYSPTLKLLLLPFVLLVSTFAYSQLKIITFELLLVGTGVFYSLFLFLTVPSPGWYLWFFPFFLLSQLRLDVINRMLLYGLLLSFFIYSAFYMSGNSLQLLPSIIPMRSLFLYIQNSSTIKSLLFTFLQASLFCISASMLYNGVLRNNIYLTQQTYLKIGLSSNSSLVSQYLLTLFRDILNLRVDILHVDSYLRFTPPLLSAGNSSHVNPVRYDLRCLMQDLDSCSPSSLSSPSLHSTRTWTNRKSYRLPEILAIEGAQYSTLPDLFEKLDFCIHLHVSDSVLSFLLTKNILDSSATNTLANEEPLALKANLRKSDLYLTIDSISPFDLTHPSSMRLSIYTFSNLFYSEIVRNLICLCDMNIEISPPQLESPSIITIAGDATSDDISHVAYRAIPFLDDILVVQPRFESGVLGVLQIILLSSTANRILNSSPA